MTLPAHYDYYSATVLDRGPDDVIEALRDVKTRTEVRACTAQNGYDRAYEIIHEDHDRLCRVSVGRQGVNVESKSNSPVIVPVVKNWAHQVSRVDACIDVVEEGFFDWSVEMLKKIAVARNLTIDQRGDWERGKSRTYYLGGRKSVIQLCLYEKGYKEDSDPNWVRLEIRLRPQKKDLKLYASNLDAWEVMCYPKWMKKYYEHVGIKYIENVKPKIWTPNDKLMARYHLVKQYGRVISELREELGGWEDFGNAVDKALTSVEQGEIPAKTVLHLKDQRNESVIESSSTATTIGGAKRGLSIIEKCR